jgi:hypothetical protein
MSTSTRNELSRRDWLRLASAGVVGYSMSGWMQALADSAAGNPQRRRACILLWMAGGPSHTDTWSLKPGHANGGLFKEIDTAAPGVKISEHMPQIARHMDKMAIIRTMDTGKANDHHLGTHILHTGYTFGGPIQYPPLGAIVAKEIGSAAATLPNFVSIAPAKSVLPGAYQGGFLGQKYAPLVVGEVNDDLPRNDDYMKRLQVPDLAPFVGVNNQRFDSRYDLLKDLRKDFVDQRPGISTKSNVTAYDRAVALMRTSARKAFNLEDESPRVRDAYGRNLFGQGCLLARRLVEQGVPFVEVTMGAPFSWDTHQNNFERVKQLSGVLDAAWSQLMNDLADRGLLDSTLMIWAGEFGRTPQLPKGRPGGGRDHWTSGWSTVLAGGGIKGGQVIGKTSADGMQITDRPVTAPEFLATVTKALGIDPTTMMMSNTGRPIPIAEKPARPIAELVG